MRSHLHAYARRIYATSFPYRYRTLSLLALSSSLHASYAISVRRTSALPAASFRFHLTMDTLAVRLTVPPVGSVGDFHSQVSAPCRAHEKKKPIRFLGWAFKFWLEIAVLEHKPEPEADRAWILEELRQIKSLILNDSACRD